MTVRVDHRCPHSGLLLTVRRALIRETSALAEEPIKLLQLSVEY